MIRKQHKRSNLETNRSFFVRKRIRIYPHMIESLNFPAARADNIRPYRRLELILKQTSYTIPLLFSFTTLPVLRCEVCRGG